MITPEQFLQITQGKTKEQSPFWLGTIPSDYVSGRPKVKFDGEPTASTKTYPYLSSYSPVANDRILLARVGNGWLAVGKVV